MGAFIKPAIQIAGLIAVTEWGIARMTGKQAGSSMSERKMISFISDTIIDAKGTPQAKGHSTSVNAYIVARRLLINLRFRQRT